MLNTAKASVLMDKKSLGIENDKNIPFWGGGGDTCFFELENS